MMAEERHFTKYIRYEIENVQPLRIADDSTSQSGQTSTLKYIPGTAIRGYVINRLSHMDRFENEKKLLFSDHVRFLNCALKRDGAELLPPLKGFYEDKKPADQNGEKHIENVTKNGKFTDGNKRAPLGSACRIEDHTIYYYHVDTGSDMKIRIKLKDQHDKQNVFRSEYILPGNVFVGYIAVDEPAFSVMEDISEAVGKKGGFIALGNARTSGMGLCRILDQTELSAEEYCRIGELPQNPVEQEIYMILISNTVMRNDEGRYCGLNLKKLERKLGVSDLRIRQCSTSVVDVRGYNSHLHLKAPSVTMYERGSVFHLSFQGPAFPEALRRVAEQGIGVRRNEGFGQVLFAEAQKYEQLDTKKEISSSDVQVPGGIDVGEDEETVRIIARNELRRKLRKYFDGQIIREAARSYAGKASESQKGSVRALLLENKYDFKGAEETLRDYFGHAKEKQKRQNVQQERAEVSGLENFVVEALNQDIHKIIPGKTMMGFPVGSQKGEKEPLISDEEFGRMKIDYVLRLFEYDNRKKA